MARPVFDIKPYIPAYDAFPSAKAGWIAKVDAALLPRPPTPSPTHRRRQNT
ncbi:hypothetical protein EMGBD4_10390 [Verrucomicrobiota bacterium]|nr:hypothetical protein EMGBD4_10390 [Verrucomicrobiota bacterium]